MRNFKLFWIRSRGAITWSDYIKKLSGRNCSSGNSDLFSVLHKPFFQKCIFKANKSIIRDNIISVIWLLIYNVHRNNDLGETLWFRWVMPGSYSAGTTSRNWIIQIFAADLTVDRQYIEQNAALCGIRDGVWKCMLIQQDDDKKRIW